MDNSRIQILADAVSDAELHGAYVCTGLMSEPKQGSLTDEQFVNAVTTAFNRSLPYHDRVVAYASMGVRDSIVGWTLRLWDDHESRLRIHQWTFRSLAFWDEVKTAVRRILDLDEAQALALLETSQVSPDPQRAVAMLRHLAETGSVDPTAYDRSDTCPVCRYAFHTDTPVCQYCGYSGAKEAGQMHYHCENCEHPMDQPDGLCPECGTVRTANNRAAVIAPAL